MKTKPNLITLLATVIFVFGLAETVVSQKAENCDNLEANLENGTLNGYDGTLTMDEIKKIFPCSTGETEENDGGMNCGGGVFYLNHYFNIYTKSDFIRLRTKFTGKMNPEVLGLSGAESEELLGKPDDVIKYEDPWLGEVTLYRQYQKDWGILVLLEKEGAISQVEMWKNAEIGSVEFCY